MPRHPVVGPDWISSAPILVEKTIDIAAPPSDVWPHIADHESWPEWFTDLDEIERIGEGAGVGSGRRVTVKRFTIDEEFTAWDENERFAFAVIKTALPVLARLAEEVWLDATDTGCRVTYRQGVEGKKYLGWAMKAVWKQAPDQVEDALANLKRRVESTAS